MTTRIVSAATGKSFDFGPVGGSDTFGARLTQLGAGLNLKGLGINLTEVPPGKRAFPFHNHLANDELFIILEGEGTFRIGQEEIPVGPGDVCGAPRGGAETAHQLINTGQTTLRYYAISTKNDPEVVEYPDSGKFSVSAIWPGEDFMKAHLRHVGRREQLLDYWDGEKT